MRHARHICPHKAIAFLSFCYRSDVSYGSGHRPPRSQTRSLLQAKQACCPYFIFVLRILMPVTVGS